FLFLLLLRRPPTPTLFPYTTLFRSTPVDVHRDANRDVGRECSLRCGCSADVAAKIHSVCLRILHFRVCPLFSRDANPFRAGASIDRKSTRLNSSHLVISYAVFCLKK